MKIQLTLFLLAAILITAGCLPKSSNDSMKMYFENLYGGDTLTFYAGFSDCGEWGGHHESIEIFRENDDLLWAKLTIDSVGCDGDNSNMTRNIVSENTKRLSHDDEIMASDYMHEVLDYSFRKTAPDHSGDVYIVKSNQFNPLRIVFYNTSIEWTGFTTLKHNLFPETKKH